MKRFCQKERSGLFGSPFQRLLFCCRRVFPVGSVAAGTEAERDDLFGLYGRTDSGCRSVDAGRRLDQECHDNSPVTMGRRALRHHQAIKIGNYMQRGVADRADYSMSSEKGALVPRIYSPHHFAAKRRRLFMVKLNIQALGNVAIFRCQGRIVAGDEHTIVREIVLSQADYTTLILDLAVVGGIDAGGLGALLGLREWTRANGMQLKIMNVPRTVQQVLEVTNLDRALEICSEEELVHLLHRAVGMEPSLGPGPDQPRIASREVSTALGGGSLRS